MFLSMNDYLLSAKKAFNRYGNVSNPDDDGITDVATAMMMADHKYDVEKYPDVSRDGYRMIRARFFVLKWINKRKKESRVLSLDKQLATESTMGSLIDSGENFVNKMINEDLVSYTKECELTSFQRHYIDEYYLKGLTYQEIADRNGTTKQNIEKHVKKGIVKLKQFMKKEK